MEEQLPYYEDRQQKAWEDYNDLVSQRDALHKQCLEQSVAIQKANERIEVMNSKLNAAAKRERELLVKLWYPRGPSGERINALEDALNRYVAKFGNCGEVYDQAVAALEVKP